MEEEIWKQIPSLPACEASSLGRVRVIPYTSQMPHGGERSYGGVARYGDWNVDRFTLFFRGRNYKIARLVCEAFHGPSPTGKNVCMHLDEDASNNRSSNLEWGTQKQNLNFPGFLDHCRNRTGQNNPRNKGRRKKGCDAVRYTDPETISVFQN